MIPNMLDHYPLHVENPMNYPKYVGLLSPIYGKAMNDPKYVEENKDLCQTTTFS